MNISGERQEFSNAIPPDLELGAHVETVRQVSQAVEQWKRSSMEATEIFTRQHLAELVKHLGVAEHEAMDRLLLQYESVDQYPERPCIKLHQGVVGEYPDIWLLGWRSKESAPEETDIHDHCDSEAAIHVFRGTIQEDIFAFDDEEYSRDSDSLVYRKASRDLSEGSTVTIKAPYIHVIKGREDKYSASIHAYYPPLDRMNLYEREDNMLVKTNSWEQKPRLKC